jgi:hypothetical protein
VIIHVEILMLQVLVLQIRAVCFQLSRQRAQDIVLRSMVLQTSVQSLGALKFYEGCGYQRGQIKADYYGRVTSITPEEG